MRVKTLEKTIDMLLVAREAMVYLEHAGCTNVNCEMDEDGDGNQFVDIWVPDFNSGNTIVVINLRGYDITITNELNNKITTLPELKEYLANGITL